MVKIISTIVLILAIILFPPAALAYISQDAIPGDSTYPIKRALEDGILAIATVNPSWKASFEQTQSDRRFTESQALLADGKSADQSLSELVQQTSIAAAQINQIQDPVQKQQLAVKLVQNIDKYNQALADTQPLANSETLSTPTPTTIPTIAPQPSATPQLTTPRPTIYPENPAENQPVPAIPESQPATAEVSPPTSAPIQNTITDLNQIKDQLEQDSHLPPANNQKHDNHQPNNAGDHPNQPNGQGQHDSNKH